MMLIHHDDEALANAPRQQLGAEYAAFNEALAKAGAGFAAGERLESSCPSSKYGAIEIRPIWQGQSRS
jgi:hypothetical protein